MRLNMPNFDIETSGVTEGLEALNRQHKQATGRLDRQYVAQEDLVEFERGLARQEAVRHFGGGLVSGGVNIANKIITTINQRKVNHAYNMARKEYEGQFDKFRRLDVQSKAEFLENGGFDKINESFLKKMEDMGDAHGVNMDAAKAKWEDYFVKNTRNVAFDTFQAVQKENEEAVGALRSEQRNQMIADPYNQKWYNGAYERSFLDSVSGIALSKEKTISEMEFDKNYGMALGYHRAKDLTNMTALLASKEAKKSLGDEYYKLLKMRDELANKLEERGGEKISGLTYGIEALSRDLDLQDFITIAHTQGFADYGNQLNNNIIDFAETATATGNHIIKVDNLAQALPEGMGSLQVKKIEDATRKAVEKMQKDFKNDPVQFIMKTTGNREVLERAEIAERTGRWLTNDEVNKAAFALESAMKKSLVLHHQEQQDMIAEFGGGEIGKKVVDEVYLRASEIKAFKSEGGRAFIDLMSVNAQIENLGNLPVAEAHQYIEEGVRIPNIEGVGEVAAQYSWSNNEALMNTFKIIAAGRTQSDPKFKEGDRDSDEYKEQYFKNLNYLSEEFQYRMQTTVPHREVIPYWGGNKKVGLRGTEISFPLSLGRNVEAQKTIERQMDRERFDDFASRNRKFFNAETRRLLQLEEVKVEGHISDGNMNFYVTEYLENGASIVNEMRLQDGSQFSMPLQKLFDQGGNIFPEHEYTLPHEGGFITGNIAAYEDSLHRRRQKRNEEAGRPFGHPYQGGERTEAPAPTPDEAKTEVNPRAIVSPNKAVRDIAINAKNVLPAVDATLSEVNNTGIPNDVLKPVVARLILQESNFNPRAVNPKDGGVGLFQITNPNLKAQLKKDPNIKVGIRNLTNEINATMRLARNLQDQGHTVTYGDVLVTALKRYNGGDRYGEVTLRKAIEGRTSTGDPNVNAYVPLILGGIVKLSPEEINAAPKEKLKERRGLSDSIFQFNSDRLMEYFDKPIPRQGVQRGPASSFDPSKLPQPEFVSFRSEVEEARDEAEFNREMDKGFLEESQKAAVFREQVKESIKRGEYTRGELEAYLNAAKVAGRSRNPDPEVPITREDIVYELRNAEFNIIRDRLRNEGVDTATILPIDIERQKQDKLAREAGINPKDYSTMFYEKFIRYLTKEVQGMNLIDSKGRVDHPTKEQIMELLAKFKKENKGKEDYEIGIPPAGTEGFKEWLSDRGWPPDTKREFIIERLKKEYGSGVGEPTPEIFARASSALERVTTEPQDEIPLWHLKDIGTKKYSQYTDKFLDAWFDFYKKESKTVADPEIPATGGLTEYEMRQQFENFKKGYKGEIYKSKSVKREPQSVDFNESVEFIKSVMAQGERDRAGASKEDRELIRETITDYVSLSTKTVGKDLKTIERVFGPATYTTNPKEQEAIQPEIFKRASEVIQKTVNEAKKAKDDKEKEKVIAKAKEEAAKEKKIFEDSVKFIKSVMAQLERDKAGATKEDRELIREKIQEYVSLSTKTVGKDLKAIERLFGPATYTTDPKKPAEITPELFKKVSELIRKLRKQEG